MRPESVKQVRTRRILGELAGMADIEAFVAALRGRASVLRGFGYRVRIDLADAPGQPSLLLDATGAVSTAAADTPADCVLRLSAGDLRRMLEGRLSPMLAFSTGRLRVEGSKGVALKLAGLLDED
jgi:ubiquinone biosynthesis protein UbiJ